MQKQISAMTLIIVLAAASWHPGFSLKYQDGKDNPTAIEDYDFVARGKMSQERGARPEQIARMDNNGEILLACLDAKTPGQLKSIGIPFLQSQLELLVDWNLLEYDRNKKTYKTTIHVYGIEKASAIRKHVDAAVKELADELNSGLISLKNHLQRFDYEKNVFAVLYAYVLHGYAMR